MILPFGQSAGKLCEIEISEKSLRLTASPASPAWKCSRATALAWTGRLHLSSKMMYLCSSIITPLSRSITVKTSSATPAVLIFAPAFTLALACRASDSLSFPLLLPVYYLIRMFSFKKARNVTGDRGLEVVANHCKKLKRIRVEPGEEEDVDVEQDLVSHIGLSTIAQGCPDLEFVAVYVSDITNSALETVGEFCKNLRDFRLVLLDKREQVAHLPLDNGVMALLRGCHKLNRFAFYARPGGLTDTGLGYIGKYGTNIRWMLLGFAGESDQGILQLSHGCSKLERLEMRGCNFNESAIASAVLNLKSLKYIWVQGYRATPTGDRLLGMSRQFWNIEYTPPRVEGQMEGEMFQENPAQILAYYSLAGMRTDNPESVKLLSFR